MEAGHNSHRAASDWIQPPEEQEGLGRYIETLRERMWVVIAAVAITTGIAILYVLTATKQYEAEADLLITPISSADTTLVGLPLIRESSDPTRAVQTAARLVRNIDVARRVQQQLQLSTSPQDLLDKVSADPVAQSNIVAVMARDNTREGARDLANAFVQQAGVEQTAQLRASIDQTLPGLRARASREPRSAAADPGSARAALAALQTLRSAPNPTIRVETLADLPTAPASPRPALSVAAGLFAGLILGIAGAFGSQVLDPRLRREDQLRRLYRLPILGRIPKEAAGAGAKPLSPLQLSSVSSEAYRTLRGLLVASRKNPSAESRAILVTGSSPSEGKTTTAINLATSLTASGNSVILIEADLRRPAIGAGLGTRAKHGVVSTMIESVALEDALITVPAFGSKLGLLLADYEGGWISELFALPAAKGLVSEARRLADYVIIDSPPLTEVIDALPLASYVDDVLIVVRIGKTHLRKLGQLGELLAENGIRPAGFAVVGTPRPSRSDYHYYAAEQRRIFTGGESQPPVGAGAQPS